MRSDKEIMEKYERDLSLTTTPTYTQNKLILEALLDIRRILHTRLR